MKAPTREKILGENNNTIKLTSSINKLNLVFDIIILLNNTI